MVWDVQALTDGRDAEPYLLFPLGDADYRRTHRFDVLGTWDAGRLVVFERHIPEEVTRTTARKDPGPQTVRLRLRR